MTLQAPPRAYIPRGLTCYHVHKTVDSKNIFTTLVIYKGWGGGESAIVSDNCIFTLPPNPPLRAGRGRGDGPRRVGPGGLRPGPGELPEASRRLLAQHRSPDGEPPVL